MWESDASSPKDVVRNLNQLKKDIVFASLISQMKSPSTEKYTPSEIKGAVDDYLNIHAGSANQRQDRYLSLVDSYYTLVTDFFEFGWGPSFHFAPRRQGESFKDSMLRQEYVLADRMSLCPGMTIVDIGCGVGGPMANLARYCGATFVGVNNNVYQIKRAASNVKDVQSLCSFLECDFMDIPVDAEIYDGAIAIESMAHAPNKARAFREVWRVLKPGSLFAGYEWCLTDVYDPQNTRHVQIKKNIEIGSGLPNIAKISEVRSALCEVGFDIVECRDFSVDADLGEPWYNALHSRGFELQGIARSPFGRAVTNVMLRFGEAVRLVPSGTRQLSTALNEGADALVEGGEIGVFTPMYFFLVRKPSLPDGETSAS